MNPYPEPSAPDAASESAIERVFRAWHEAVPAQGRASIRASFAGDFAARSGNRL